MANYKWKFVIQNFDVPMYIDLESTFSRKFWDDLPRGSVPEISATSKEFCSVYRLHGTQNDQLELSIFLWIFFNWVPRNQQKCFHTFFWKKFGYKNTLPIYSLDILPNLLTSLLINIRQKATKQTKQPKT